MIRINKREARKRFEMGERLYILPCRMRIDNRWMSPFHFKKDEIGDATFDHVVNMYEYYNCQYNETGKYVAFYVEDENV